MNDSPASVTWTTSFWVFTTRTILIAGFTTIIFGAFPPIGQTINALLLWSLVFAGTLLFYAILFDDLAAWNRHRRDEWTLDNHSLTFRDGFDACAAVALHDITKMKRWFWWGLRIKLKSGRSFEMVYLPKVGRVRKTIQSRIANGTAL